MKKLLALIPFLAGVAVYFVYQKINAPAMDVAAAKEDITVEAKALFTEFSSNETAANAKYLEKVIKFCGTAADDAVTKDGSTTISLETDDAMGVVLCELDSEAKHEKTEFKKGEKICFKGLCSGFTSDVVVNRCVATE